MISRQVMKQKSFFVGDVIDKSTKLTPRYHTRQQVAEIIAAHLIQKGRVWAREDADGPLLSSQPCCIVGALVPGGQGWTDEREHTGSILSMALKYPHFQRLFAHGVFDAKCLVAAQDLNNVPENWQSGELTDDAWRQYVSLARQYGARLGERANYGPRRVDGSAS